MSNRQARREQSRQARRQATSYRGGGRSRGSSQGGGDGGSSGGGGRGPNFLSWPFLIGVSLLAAVLLALVIVLALRNGGDDELGDPPPEIDQALADLPIEMQNGTKLGSDDAPVKLVQFEDFQCPHCLTYTLNIEPFLVEEFVKAGLLQIEFRHYPVVGRESVTAAVASECAAEQNRMFEYANRLFAKQAEGDFYPDQGVFSEENLVEIARELGLNTDEFAACQARPDALSPVARGQSAAQAYGFRGTPNFVINDLPVQAPPQTIEGWREMIEEAIAAATAEDEADEDPEGEAETEGAGEDESDAEDDDGS